MASIRKTDHGYEIQYYDGKGGRHYKNIRAPHSKTGKRAAEAEANRLETAAHSIRLDAVPTVRQICDRWWTLNKPGWAWRHTEQTRSRLDNWVLPRWGDELVVKVDAADVTLWFDGIDRAPGTKKAIYQAFSGALNWAAAERIIDRNPILTVKLADSVYQPTTIPDTAAIKRTLKQATDPFWHALLTVAISTGMRQGELSGLQWVDVGDSHLFISRSVDSGGNVKSTKSQRGVRRISLGVNAIDALSSWRQLSEEQSTSANIPWTPARFVFTRDPFGETPMKPAQISKWWRRNRCDETIRFHDLRHHAASIMLGAGHDPITVAGRLGHDPSVLLKRYGHVIPERDVDAAASVDRLLS